MSAPENEERELFKAQNQTRHSRRMRQPKSSPESLRETRRALPKQQRTRPLDAIAPLANSKATPSRRRLTGLPPSNILQHRRLSISGKPANAPLEAKKTARPALPNPKTASDSPTGMLRDRRPRSAKVKRRALSPLVYCLRLLILGIGLSAIAGTILSIWNPANRQPLAASPKQSGGQQALASAAKPALKLSQEIAPLKTSVQKLAAENPQLQPGIFVIDLDNGAYLNWQGNTTFAAASTIKVPILVAFFQDVDAGKIRLDEQLTLTPNAIASGSGEMQYQKPGTKFNALETITKMIAISDNTATNMIVDRLGGAAGLNQRFKSWGLKSTVIRNVLPDIEGTNTTSPEDLAKLLGMVNQGELVSLRSRDRLLQIMQRTVNNSLLPSGLGEGVTIAHKTGNIGSLVGDAGLIDLPTGKRYIAVALVKRPANDARAQNLIRQVSRAAYQYFMQPANPNQKSNPVPLPGSTSSPFIRASTTQRE